MPIFEYNGKKYNVKDEHIDSFMNDFPDASTIMERDGKKYRVKSSDYKSFLSEKGTAPVFTEQQLNANENASSNEPLTGFWEGAAQGGKSIWQGMKYATGEALNQFQVDAQEYKNALSFLDSKGADFDPATFDPEAEIKAGTEKRHEARVAEWKATKEKRKQEREKMGFWERVKHAAGDPIEPKREDYLWDDINYNRPINLVAEALKESGGDVAKARAILEEKSKMGETSAQELMRESSEELSNMRPVEGAAWWGQLAPQMVGQGAALALRAVPHPVAQGLSTALGVGSTGALMTSAAGSTMHEARQAGASDDDVLKAGMGSLVIEGGTEALPMGRLLGRVGNSAVREGISKALGKMGKEAGSEVVEEEMNKLLKEAKAKIGGKFLSFKTGKELFKDMVAEGGSELVAEMGGQLLPLIYNGDMPTLKEYFGNSLEGFASGFVMGGFLGGGSTALTHYGHQKRREAQGGVMLGEYTDANGNKEWVEVTSSKDGKSTILRQDGTSEEVINERLSNPLSFTIDEWKKGVVDSYHVRLEHAYASGKSATDPAEMQSIGDAYDAEFEYFTNTYGTNKAKFVLNDPMGVISKLQGQEQEDALRLAEAYNKFSGVSSRFNEDAKRAQAEAEAVIDSHVSQTDGMIHKGTLKGGRNVYIVSGDVVQKEDGSVDVNASSGSVAIADANSGELTMVSPDEFVSAEQAVDPEEERELARQAIYDEFQTKKIDALKGAVSVGDTHTVLDPEGNLMQVQVVADNGDGTVNVTMDGQNVVPVSKDELVRYDRAMRRMDYQKQRALDMQRQSYDPTYHYGDNITFTDEDGSTISGKVVSSTDEGVQIQTPLGVLQRPLEMLNDAITNVTDEDGNVRWDRANPVGATSENEGSDAVASNGTEGSNTTPQAELSEVKKRMPKNDKGELLYEQAEADDAWDAILEDTDNDVEMAQRVANEMVAQKEAELKAIEKKKTKSAIKPQEKIAIEKARKAEITKAKQDLEAWKNIAGTTKRREEAAKAEERRRAEEAAAQRKAEEARLKAEREEALRQEREALNGVPDMADDTPQDARARGYRRVGGHKVERQSPVRGVAGKDVQVKFSNKAMPQGRVMVIDANELQPSHTQGQRNAQHFLDEAQTKERKDSASMLAAQKIAENIRPEEITSSVTAYTGAPTTNSRGEVIQGNSRSDALKQMWDSYPEQAAKYKQYLIDHAEELGLDVEAVAQMERPVLVNMLEVADEDAITLGQFVAQDTESGGTERIKAKNVLQKMGSEMRNFANRLLQSADEETSFAGLIDANGASVIQWMAQKGYITPTQQQSAYDGKGNLTAEAKNDLRSIMYQSIFKGGNTQLEEMFNALPVKAQKAILATAYRDFDSPVAERMIEELQSSISAFYVLSQDPAFASARNITEARAAIEAWKHQYQMDDVTGESYLPSDKFSNFALHLATMYKGENQSVIQGTFNKMFDLIQGIQEADLFNENPDTTPRTLVEAIKEVLNIDYNGQLRSNVLGDNHPASQRGQQGSTGNVASGKQNQDGQGTDDGGRGTGISDIEPGGQRYATDTTGRQHIDSSQKELDENGHPFVVASNGTTTFGVITEETGLPTAPIKLSEGFQNEDGKGYGLLHIEANHGQQIRNAGFSSVEEFVSFVATNYDENNIRVGKRRDKSGSITYLIQVTDEHDNTLFIELSRDGSYWNVNSGGVFRKGYSDKKRTVVKTEPQQPNNAVSTDSSLSESGVNGITPTEPNGESTVPFSNSKGTDISSEKQKTEGENVDDNERKSPIAGYSYNDVIDGVTNDIQNALSEAGIEDEVTIDEVWAHGSRMRGDAKADSDLDVVMFYQGNAKEDALFNTINGAGITFDGVKVDVNPIQVRTQKDIDRYKQKSAQYDAGVRVKRSDSVATEETKGKKGTKKNAKKSSALDGVVEGKIYKNNIAGGDAVAVVRGKSGGQVLVAYASDMEDAQNGLFMGEELVSDAEMAGRLERGEFTEIGEKAESNLENASLVKGAKWEQTGEPEKFKARTKKHADSHDVSWRIGKKQYGSTIAERDLLCILADEYDSLAAIWNAYENGEILLSKNEAAILKKLIETDTTTTELQQGELDLDVDNPAFERATERTIDTLKAAGVEVVEATDEMVEEVLGLAEMHKQKKAPETESVLEEEHQPSVVSSADGAKVLKDLDSLIKDYDENANKRPNTFLGDIAQVLGATKHGSNSQYATFEAVNGKVFTIRLANHNAKVSNFDNHGENEGISIVVTAQDNNGINNDGKAHVVEFFYDAIKLRKADGKPLVEILKSIKQALYSGEYKDTTGLAQAEEVNIPEFMQVYHGSGAKFDKFDHSFMGTGEGAQAFGWGTYVTEVEGIGRRYATNTSDNIFKTGFGDFYLKKIREGMADGKSFEDIKQNLLDYHAHVYEQTGGDKDMFGGFISDYETLRSLKEEDLPKRNLYTVEIPDDTGKNYLYWYNGITDEQKKMIADAAQKEGIEFDFYGDKMNANKYFAEMGKGIEGHQLYGMLKRVLGSDKAASEFLNGIGYVGIKYPAESLSGGNKDGKSNYVIFNEADAKITDRVEFLRTADGVVYGWAVDGKIYLTKEGMNPNTPAHEYTHLWAHMIEKTDPVTWSRIVDGLRGCATWNEVLNDKAYESIWNDDSRMASEVLSRLTGSENYRREMARAQQEIADAKGALEKAEKISAWEKVKMALRDFLGRVKSLIQKGERRKEKGETIRDVETDVPAWMEFVDMALGDLYGGVNPVEVVNRRGRDAQSVETIVKEFGLNPPALSEIINSRSALEWYSSRIDEDIYEGVLQSYDKGCGGVSVTADGYSLVFIFKEHCKGGLDEQMTWWHEQAHCAYIKAKFEKMRLAYDALDWLEDNAPLRYNNILNSYDRAYWEDEAVAVFIEELVTRYGTSKFLEADFAELGELATLADVIRNSIKNGTEDTNQKIEAGYRFGKPASKSLPRPVGRQEDRPHYREGSIEERNRVTQEFRGDASQGTGRPEADELNRNDGRSYTDDELSAKSDPMAKMLGASTYSARQRREFAERARKRMVRRAESIAKELHLDNVEVVTDVSVLPEGKKRGAKGFYSKSTGKITIVVPNHAGTYDIQQTVLHEAVAHYGLRQLFGTHFDTFLDNVFENVSSEIRNRIIGLARQNGWDFRTATEEYLAMLAEDVEFSTAQKSSWWSKIKGFFLKMLADAGVKLDFTLSDNELRYILWRSYQNLANPGKYASVVEQAADIAKQYDLKVGNYRDSATDLDAVAEQVREREDVLFREDTPRERAIIRDRYERRVKTGWYQTQEALQDSMLGLKEAMEAIVGDKTYIEDIEGFENAYLGENRLSSVNKAEIDWFVNTHFKPLYEIVKGFASTEEEQEVLEDYMFAKHGLERNRVMAEREAQKAYDAYKAEHPRGSKTLSEFVDEYRKQDYAGLTALTGKKNVADAEAEAQRMVKSYEAAHTNTDLLWMKWNQVTKAILEKTYKSGIISKKTFDKISGMYEYYVPLRGFDETTSMDEYAYLGKKDNGFNPPVKVAGGRRSKADNPFAYLESMAESAIMQGNRNELVKQKMLNFVLNHPSDLFSVSELWLEHDDVTDEWKPVFPTTLSEYDSPEEIQQKMDNFEARMEALAKADPDKYKRGRDAKDIPYRVVDKATLSEHQVIVKRNGKSVVITVNGNPRAAQALNGMTNPDNHAYDAIGRILRAGEYINRKLSTVYTTRNPDFVASNFLRDTLYTNTMVWVKESPNYALKFHKNWALCNPFKMGKLYKKYQEGTLDMSDELEVMFKQFMLNGGETGYMNMSDVEAHKKEIAKKLRGNKYRRAWDCLNDILDYLNRTVENTSRFAAFVTSRQMGRSIDRSIYDAKEISVNFNKKGSGGKFLGATGQTGIGNAASIVSALGRSGFVFWNAGIQGSTNFGRQVKRHPAKALTAAAAMFMLGAVMAYFGLDDDDEDYYNVPDYIRRSNIMIPTGGDHFISLPLPIEFRAMYGMGELMMSVMSGKERKSGWELGMEIASQLSQVMPIDVLEGGGGWTAFVPSSVKPIVEVYRNVGWSGLPIYKDNPFNELNPEYTEVYSNTHNWTIAVAEWLNNNTGGDAHTKGAININPAAVEYLLSSYLGGYSSTVGKLIKMGETIAGEREYDPRSFLLWNRLVKSGDERTEERAITNEYFKLRDEAEVVAHRLRGYEKDTKLGIFDYSEKIDFLEQSPEYGRYIIFEPKQKYIDRYERKLKEAQDRRDDDAVSYYKELITDVQRDIVEECREYDRLREESGK